MRCTAAKARHGAVHCAAAARKTDWACAPGLIGVQRDGGLGRKVPGPFVVPGLVVVHRELHSGRAQCNAVSATAQSLVASAGQCVRRRTRVCRTALTSIKTRSASSGTCSCMQAAMSMDGVPDLQEFLHRPQQAHLEMKQVQVAALRLQNQAACSWSSCVECNALPEGDVCVRVRCLQPVDHPHFPLLLNAAGVSPACDAAAQSHNCCGQTCDTEGCLHLRHGKSNCSGNTTESLAAWKSSVRLSQTGPQLPKQPPQPAHASLVADALLQNKLGQRQPLREYLLYLAKGTGKASVGQEGKPFAGV